MQNVYTVAQVNSYIKNMFTQDFMLKSIFVKGEVSNCKYHSSGHIYFTLKDAKGVITCVMFAGSRAGLSFQMQEGQMVVVGGTIDVYERDGKYQLYAKQIVLDGAGRLYEKFEQLKQELAEMGMFAPEYKQPIPKYIQKLGVVTAATGAAVRDIIEIATRRNPYIQIILYPAIVQGEQAAESIVNGINALELFGVDAIIVGRGGGSIEDLWAFNEKIVAQAVFDCSIPIISAVGHETDTTIIDFVADLRAPTPSAAAELAVYDVRQLQGQLLTMQMELNRRLGEKLQYCREKFGEFERSVKLLSPANRLNDRRQMAADLADRLALMMQQRLTASRHELELYAGKLEAMSPAKKMSQGYAFVSDQAGRGIQGVDNLQQGDLLTIHMMNGRVKAQVCEIAKEAAFEQGCGN